MMKKLVSIGLIGLLSCTMLTACSNSQNNSSSSSTEKTTTVKKSSKLTATNMNTKKQTAITIAYTGEKYPNIWKKTFKQAQNNTVTVRLHNRKDFHICKMAVMLHMRLPQLMETNISTTPRMTQLFSSITKIKKLVHLILNDD